MSTNGICHKVSELLQSGYLDASSFQPSSLPFHHGEWYHHPPSAPLHHSPHPIHEKSQLNLPVLSLSSPSPWSLPIISLLIYCKSLLVSLFQPIIYSLSSSQSDTLKYKIGYVTSFREGNGTPLQHSFLENPKDGGAWWAAVHGVANSQTQLSDFTFTFHFHALEKEMATHSSVLAWRIPGTGEPGGLLSMRSHRVRHD